MKQQKNPSQRPYKFVLRDPYKFKMEKPVGYAFRPTDEELISHYLRNKIDGDVSLVDKTIGEINVCEFDPWELRSQSRIESVDLMWYFFSLKDRRAANANRRSRMTRSGYWKITGPPTSIRAKRGDHGEIGVKKTLVFFLGRSPNAKRTLWFMHEYDATFLPSHQSTYFICKVRFDGEVKDIPSGTVSQPSRSLAFHSSNMEAMNTAPKVDQPVQETSGSSYGLSKSDLTMQLNKQGGQSVWEVQSPNESSCTNYVHHQTPYLTRDDDEFLKGLKHVNRELVEHLFISQEQVSYTSMQENCNDYRPQKSLTGIYVDSGSDSDAESVSAMSYQETSSPVDSVGSSNGHYQTRTDAFGIDEILSLGADDHKQSPTTWESSIRRKARKSQSQPKNLNGEARKHPTRIQLQGKHHHTMPPKEEVSEFTESFRAAEPSTNKNSTTQETKREQKMAEGANKKTSPLVKTEKKGCFILQDTIEKSCKNPPYIYLMNLIIGLILFVALIGEIMVVL